MPLPAPRGVTGMPCSAASRSTSSISARDSHSTAASGGKTPQPRLVAPVVSSALGRAQHALASQLARQQLVDIQRKGAMHADHAGARR